MATKKKSLGKGLDALFHDNDTIVVSTSTLKISEIEPNKNQPRTEFALEQLTELADSIKTHGVIQPLLVRPLPSGQYQIVAGERRWRASRMAGLNEVPVVVQDMDDSKVMQIALIENLQRQDLNSLEESLGFQKLMDDFNLTQDEVAQTMGKSRSSIANSLRLLNLTDFAKKMLQDGHISKGHAKVLLAISDQNIINTLCSEIKHKGLSVRQLEKILLSIQNPKVEEKQLHTLGNTYFREVELSLIENLGTDVKIKESKNKKTIEIEFSSEEDLSHIVNKLTKL